MRVASLVHFPIDQKFVLSSIRIPPQTTNLDKMLDSRTTRSATKTSCNSDFTDFQSTHKNHQRCGSHCLFCQKTNKKLPKFITASKPWAGLGEGYQDIKGTFVEDQLLQFLHLLGDLVIPRYAMPLCRYATHAIACGGTVEKSPSAWHGEFPMIL